MNIECTPCRRLAECHDFGFYVVQCVSREVVKPGGRSAGAAPVFKDEFQTLDRRRIWLCGDCQAKALADLDAKRKKNWWPNFRPWLAFFYIPMSILHVGALLWFIQNSSSWDAAPDWQFALIVILGLADIAILFLKLGSWLMKRSKGGKLERIHAEIMNASIKEIQAQFPGLKVRCLKNGSVRKAGEMYLVEPDAAGWAGVTTP